VADNNAAYYYHYDGLGSVVALSDSDGDSCQSYEYSAYGQVAASDPNFIANPYMFTGRRFDIETGLYYYRARYYNPHIGRFMQTDPVGYNDDINWYLYCGNNPLGFVDPSGFTRAADIIMEWDIANGGEWVTRDGSTAPTSLLPLISHYFIGNGVSLYFEGGEWGDLILEDTYMQNSIRQHLLQNVRHYMSLDEYQGDWNCLVPGGYGYSSTSFDVDESKLKRYLGGGGLYINGTWTKETSEDGIVTLTMEASFTFYDTADLHPERLYWRDILGKMAEIYWNYYQPGYLLTHLTNMVAQPYQILISTEPVAIEMTWDPDKPGTIDVDF